MNSREAPARISAFSTAITAAESVIGDEAQDPRVRQRSRSRLCGHGHRTARAVLMLHGYTHAPEQYDGLAEEFHDGGYNVWIPRAPQHGTVEANGHHLLNAAELRRYAEEALRIVRGLGDEVGVVGISGGAVLAAWLAGQHEDVRRMLLLSPFFRPDVRTVPVIALRPLAFLYGRRLLPDRTTSRGYSLAAVTQYLRIALGLPRQPRRTGLRSLGLVYSEADAVIDRAAAMAAAQRFANANAIDLGTLVLPASSGVAHNTLDPVALGDEASALYGRYRALYEGTGPL
ncbi:alpha/beta hydrolase [Plantactinospora sp. WMMC1484]|uniref:alpha/beta hydrolase n=1 Tax=Plantactinospora sp. WMMC1484 TaxID=3404122 RepID=UPI003BF5D1DE